MTFSGRAGPVHERGTAGGPRQLRLPRACLRNFSCRGVVNMFSVLVPILGLHFLQWCELGIAIDRECHRLEDQTLECVPGCQGVEARSFQRSRQPGPTFKSWLPGTLIARFWCRTRGGAGRPADKMCPEKGTTTLKEVPGVARLSRPVPFSPLMAPSCYVLAPTLALGARLRPIASHGAPRAVSENYALRRVYKPS